MSAFWLFQSAFIVQLLSLALFLAFGARPTRGFSVAATAALGLATALQALFTLQLAWVDRDLPLTNAFEALNLWALLFNLVALRLELRYKVGLLGAFLSPFSALLLLMGIRFSHVVPQAPFSLPPLFLFFHVLLPRAGYALFTAAAAVAWAWFLLERQLKSGRLRFDFELPSLETMEGLAFRLCGWGLGGLSVGLLAGFFGGLEAFKVRLTADPKIAMSGMAWCFYAALLFLKSRGLRGRRFSGLLLLGWVVLFLSYYLVNVYGGGHTLSAGGR
jgi:ABC-type uncharacterized transport system permease subunit